MHAAMHNPIADIRLCDAALGQSYWVVDVDLPGHTGDRLVELGLTPAAPVRVLRRAPFGGPLQLQVRDYVLSMRRDQAASIRVAAAGTER